MDGPSNLSRITWARVYPLTLGGEPVLFPGEVPLAGVVGRQALLDPLPVGADNRFGIGVDAAFVGARAILEVTGLGQGLDERHVHVVQLLDPLGTRTGFGNVAEGH